jgi:hypothetical protein
VFKRKTKKNIGERARRVFIGEGIIGIWKAKKSKNAYVSDGMTRKNKK